MGAIVPLILSVARLAWPVVAGLAVLKLGNGSPNSPSTTVPNGGMSKLEWVFAIGIILAGIYGIKLMKEVWK